ncbi:hypothetical protein B566_EDAN017413 [Ephemera danica]|nr:hypothetical protein B566_EDAN017413 [Ephemera danica]
MGEICVNSPSLFIGYLKQGQQPEKRNFDKDGFFHTGDLGFIDASGNVYAVERLNFTFKVGVAPVVPSDLEALLQEHPSVHSAAVVGIPDPVKTHLIRAYIVLKPGHHATADDFIKFIDARVPEYKHLTGGVRFVKNLPVNRNGKLDRRKLTDMALAEK